MPTFHSHVTDPLGASADANQVIAAASGPTSRVTRRSLLGNRVNWGNFATPGFQFAQGPMLTAAARIEVNQSGAASTPATIGVAFTALRDFSLVGCRIYKAPTQAGSIPIGVWNAAGTMLATKTVTWVSDGGGWRTILFDTPAAIANSQNYTIGYLTPGDDYAFTSWTWNAQDAVTYPFWIKQGGGRAHVGASLTFPTAGESQSHNFYVDPIAEWTIDTPGWSPGYYDQFVNGGPTNFPVTVFFADPPNIQGYADMGINGIVTGGAPNWNDYIEAIKSAGIDWWPTVHGNDMTGPKLTQLDPELATLIRGYHLTDEPDLVTPYNSPAVIKTWRDNARMIDSTRPIIFGMSKVVALNQGFFWQPPGASPQQVNQEWRDYAALCDVISLDNYSLAADDSYAPSNEQLNGSGPVYYGTWAYPPQIGRLREITDDSKEIWATIETTSEVAGRPTVDEVIRTCWAVLIAGARGLIFFDHRFQSVTVTQDFATMLNNPPMAEAVQALSAQLQTLKEPLLAPDADVIESITSSNVTEGPMGGTWGVPIAATSRLTDTETFIIAQASRPGSTVATIKCRGLASTTLTVVGEGRTVDVGADGIFTDTFSAPYEHHIYQGGVYVAPEASQPDPPTGVSASGGNGRAVLTWVAPFDGDSAITGYSVIPYIGATAQTPISTGSTTPGFTVTGLTNGTAYTFKVRAINAIGSSSESTASNAVTPAVPAPSDLSVAVLAKGPEMYWRLDDLLDSSGNGYTLIGSGPTDQPALPPSDTEGVAKGFGNNGYTFDIPGTLDPVGGITFEAWFEVGFVGSLAIQSIINLPFSTDLVFGLRQHDSGHVYFHAVSNGQTVFMPSSVAYTVGEMRHFVGVFHEADQTITLYVNGVLDTTFDYGSTQTLNSIPPGTGSLGSAIPSVGMSAARATIDEVAVYLRPLDAAEVLDNYTVGTEGSGGGGGGGADPLAALSRVAWDGGSDYYSVAQEGAKMTNAEASGWSDPSFLPISVFLADPEDAAHYQSLGINTYMMCNHTPPITDITDLGMNVIVYVTTTFPSGVTENEWAFSDLTGNERVVGYFIYDEAEQGEGNFWDVDIDGGPGSTDARRLEYFQTLVTNRRARADGRFMFSNFAKGVLHGEFSGGQVIEDFIDSVDASATDLYVYTAGSVRDAIEDEPNSPDYPAGANSQRAATYGWTVAQQKALQSPPSSQPAWVLVETKKPFLGETTAGIITYAQIAGAVWSSIVHEARGVVYFTHNGFYPPNIPAIDPNTGVAPDQDTWSLVDCEIGVQTAVAAVNAQVTALAPVINTQSYVWDFGATGIDTMLKSHGGFAYIFASVGIQGTTGSKTFTLPAGITGTSVEVVNESRSLTVTAGAFTDTFAAESSHHIYKIAL